MGCQHGTALPDSVLQDASASRARSGATQHEIPAGSRFRAWNGRMGRNSEEEDAIRGCVERVGGAPHGEEATGISGPQWISGSRSEPPRILQWFPFPPLHAASTHQTAAWRATLTPVVPSQ